jgi:D-alanyl-D-alanine carboxypeptidase
LVASAAHAAEPKVTARAAIIVDATNGEVIWERNGDLPLPPASTTKILTAIVALESGRLDDSFTVSAEAASTAPAKVGFRAGQSMVLRDLLYAVLLKSANDAAAVVAEGVAGSEYGFARRMNAKARAIGAENSNFVNPHGLSVPGHVSTVRDLTRIFRYGMRLPMFRAILETPATEVPLETGASTRMIALRSHNRLLQGWDYRVIGKTGYTRPAKRCFVGAANHDGKEIVIALLGSTDLWGDARRLVSFGLGDPAAEEHEIQEEPAPVPVLRASKPAKRGKAVPVLTAKRPTRPEAPVQEGDLDPSPRVSSMGRGRYTVRIGPFRTTKETQVAKAKLAKKGYSASASGRTLTLGQFSNKARAQTLATRLRLTGYRPTIASR